MRLAGDKIPYTHIDTHAQTLTGARRQICHFACSVQSRWMVGPIWIPSNRMYRLTLDLLQRYMQTHARNTHIHAHKCHAPFDLMAVIDFVKLINDRLASIEFNCVSKKYQPINAIPVRAFPFSCGPFISAAMFVTGHEVKTQPRTHRVLWWFSIKSKTKIRRNNKCEAADDGGCQCDHKMTKIENRKNQRPHRNRNSLVFN